MKKLIALIAVTTAFLPTAHAQLEFAPVHEPRLYVVPQAGYRFGGEVKDNNTGEKAKIKSAASYGLVLGWAFTEDASVEFLYSTQQTEVDYNGANTDIPQSFDITVNNYHVGARYSFMTDALQPFMMWSAGVTDFDVDGPGSRDTTAFSTALSGGLHYMVSKHVGLRLSGQALGAFVGDSQGASCGTGGCRLWFGGPILFQGEVDAGLVVSF